MKRLHLITLAMLAAFPSKGEAREVVRCETYQKFDLANPRLPDSTTCRDETKKPAGKERYTS